MFKKIVLLSTILLFSGCMNQVNIEPDDKTIYTINTGVSNVFLIKFKKGNILIDTSYPGKEEFIINELKSFGVAPENISLIIITHAHGDHAGNAQFFKEKYHIPVLIGEGDESMAKEGRNRELKPTGLLGMLLKPFVEYTYKPFTPDLVAGGQGVLYKYGINGQVMHTGGHTAGSLVVILNDGSAFVGDLIRGGIIANEEPALHFFHEDANQADFILKLLLKMKVKVFYPGHFGPLKAEKIRSYLKKKIKKNPQSFFPQLND